MKLQTEQGATSPEFGACQLTSFKAFPQGSEGVSQRFPRASQGVPQRFPGGSQAVPSSLSQIVQGHKGFPRVPKGCSWWRPAQVVKHRGLRNFPRLFWLAAGCRYWEAALMFLLGIASIVALTSQNVRRAGRYVILCHLIFMATIKSH